MGAIIIEGILNGEYASLGEIPIQAPVLGNLFCLSDFMLRWTRRSPRLILASSFRLSEVSSGDLLLVVRGEVIALR